ncbi:cell division protein FtsK [Actinoplanes sp. SE50]|uniref:FtsK/SpoIIIE domain-containing protein n=1 Tax=unclassified Actinoplanes TaxID=2626549 RepID=UPI00023EDF94|nr:MULTISPECIES: FtsK/SpoIIIE domain-containing protein [unclassified Actinoplanes]AEV88314.1 DNA translocase ftsK [Actinoplanes sp. SE50/110]ATO86719.1 cell division protein FtsK [Actinoplanes sp. SE50]SLM04137.1 cell division protein FtsK [Actinoplanes sp. SE50/110]
MGSHRNALVAAVRQELAEARGTARAVLAAAESARGEAQGRRRLVRDAYATCLNQLAEAREAARDDIERRFRGEATRLAGHLRGLATSSATGAAGAPWRLWSPSEPDPGSRPGLLRIGAITFEETAALPGLIPLLDAVHLHVSGPSPQVDDLITGVLLRALGSTRAGDVHLTVYDPENLGGTLAPFAPLNPTFVGPGGLGSLLDDLAEHICRVHESLGGQYPTLADMVAARPGPRLEPWKLVVLLADRATSVEMTTAQRAQLGRIVRTGVACGVHLVVRGLELADDPSIERIVVREQIATCGSLGSLEIRLDPPPPPDRIAAFCRTTAERLQAGAGPARLADLEPAKHWTESSVHGLVAPIGDSTDGTLVEVPLGDDPPHALIGGPSGSGKTNLIYTWLGSLATRYGPEELALYLLDFKEGVSFARYAPGPRDPSWLPQVRLAGINVNGDREFGLAMLRHLGEELRTRAQAAKRCDAGKLSELRAEDPAGHWPRIVAVIDEFQVLLAGRDAVADEAVDLLEDLARRGRSQGIHLILASQDVAGIQALWGRPGLIAQFTLRIALPKARRILAEDNLAAAVIPRFHAVVNTESGLSGANRIVRLPDAGDRLVWRALQRTLWRERPAGCAEPRIFDGDAVPRLPGSLRPAGRMPAGDAPIGSSPGAVLGERIDVAAQPARLRLGRMPGRNLAVLGTRVTEACDVLSAAALSLAAQGPAHFSVICLDPSAQAAANRLYTELPSADWYDAGNVHFDLAFTDVPHYVIGFALDAARQPGLRTLLAEGPERRTHTLGWWRSVPRLRDDLGGVGARFDAIGAWVALDVHGADLAPLHPQPGGPAWYPRPRRALFFDRSVHRTPEVIIPYEVTSDRT